MCLNSLILNLGFLGSKGKLPKSKSLKYFLNSRKDVKIDYVSQVY